MSSEKGRNNIGTNYYLCYKRGSDAENIDSGLHIGKNSAGWVFNFQAHYKPEIKTVRTWKKLTRAGFIYNEYGVELTYEEFWTDIVEGSKKKYYGRDPYVLEDPENPEPHLFGCWEDEGFAFSEGDFC